MPYQKKPKAKTIKQSRTRKNQTLVPSMSRRAYDKQFSTTKGSTNNAKKRKKS